MRIGWPKGLLWIALKIKECQIEIYLYFFFFMQKVSRPLNCFSTQHPLFGNLKFSNFNTFKHSCERRQLSTCRLNLWPTQLQQR